MSKMISDAMVEKAAQPIYDRFIYDEHGAKPAWVPHGNSLKQDDARRYARAALGAVAPDIRNQVIEECADAVDQWFNADTGAFIRSLKSKP
jgi:hypothetical protein